MSSTLKTDNVDLGRQFYSQVVSGTLKCFLILFVILPTWSALLMYVFIFSINSKVLFIILTLSSAAYLFYRMAKIYIAAYLYSCQ